MKVPRWIPLWLWVPRTSQSLNRDYDSIMMKEIEEKLDAMAVTLKKALARLTGKTLDFDLDTLDWFAASNKLENFCQIFSAAKAENNSAEQKRLLHSLGKEMMDMGIDLINAD